MQITLDSWMVVPSASGTISIVGMTGGKLIRQLIHSFSEAEIVSKKDHFTLGSKMPGSWASRLVEFRPEKAAQLKVSGII